MSADSLPGLLADAGIRLKSLRPGITEHIICPKCHGGSTGKETSLAVTIDADGGGATWMCHRGTCGGSGGGRVVRKGAWQPKTPTRHAPLPQHTPAQLDDRPPWLYDFFAERNIGAPTVDHFEVYTVERNFPGLGKRPAIVFPYRRQKGGEVVARKYRPFPEKSPQSQDNTGEPTLYNAQVLDPVPEELIWVEGEPDAMALHECGFPNVVSLRDGAPAQARFKPDDARFAALKTHGDALDKVKRHILAGDMDGPGMALREELARRLGRHKVSLVMWPEGCKDACDTLRLTRGDQDGELRSIGLEAVKQAVKAAEPYPIDGIYRTQLGELTEARKRPEIPTMTTGVGALDQYLHLPTEGALIVVTGQPNHGKSAWVRSIMVHTAKKHARQWLVFSPEHPMQQFKIDCAQALIRKPFRPKGGMDPMTDEEVTQAEQFQHDHLLFLQCDAEERAPTLDWLLERAAYCVLRDGVSDFLIDPWNEIEHARGDLSETDYIGRVLQRLRMFGSRYGCNVWVVAHPAKPPPLKSGDKAKPPGAYDISGSAHWANKSDLGLTVWAPERGWAEIHIWKSRFLRWGCRGTGARLDYDAIIGTYSTSVHAPAGGGPAAWVEDDT